MDPRHRVVIVTGASAGIGAATARLFAAAGARLVLAARSREPLERLAANLPGAVAVPTDVSDPAQCRALVEFARGRHGRVDILINNAGVGLAGPVADLSADDLERALAVNLFGPLWLMQAVTPLMRAQGRGQIINVSTVLAEQPLPYLGGYAATKAALERLSETLRMELLGAGVRVTVVRPGSTRTEFRAHRLGAGREQRRMAPPAVPPEAVARVILRAARREPRRAYVTFGDRLAIWAARMLPGPVEALLSRAITWETSAGPVPSKPEG
ncbi:MAG: SDR family NAD(P)-dependent oxidoreductase [Oscillochloridaceae bacterium]|nr:SDR family NAD(P)-dependent oxidoreductase [Chloroflexaceae bacterium]MDW8390235.1 SDR family NAD(P)-dependent oxidoreductase [Oscillochloridaceae bacterium]